MSPTSAPILPGLPGVTETQVGSFKYRLSYNVLCGSFPLPYCTLARVTYNFLPKYWSNKTLQGPVV